MNGRGRPALATDNYIGIWVLVEAMRDRQHSQDRNSVRGAVARLKNRLGPSVIVTDTVRKAYERAARLMQSDPYMASCAEADLEGYRKRREERGWNSYPLDLLYHL